MTPLELSDYDFVERVTIIMEACGVDEREAVETARRQRREAQGQQELRLELEKLK